MKKIILIAAGMLALLRFADAQPTDNAIASFYSGDEGYPAWTDEIKWDNVIVMADQGSGEANFTYFETQRDLLYSQGGGVLYYPAGTYRFSMSDAPDSRGLMLKKGVVIRGEKPSTDDKAVIPGIDIQVMSKTDHGLNSMPTKFIFDTTTLNGYLKRGIPKMWNGVCAMPGANESNLGEVSHIGICWVEIEYGYVYFGMGNNMWASSYQTAGVTWIASKVIGPWKNRVPDGTHPMDRFCGAKQQNDSCILADKRFVFGVHIKHGGVPNYVNRMGFLESTFRTESGPWWFGAKISVYGRSVLVANNVISFPTKCFTMYQYAGVKNKIDDVPVGDSALVAWDYGVGLSVDVNKNYIAWFKNRSAIRDVENSQYTSNVIVQDNWVYNHSSKGFDIAGGWMLIRNNVNRRDYHSNVTDVYGLGLSPIYAPMSSNGCIHKSATADDYMTRAYTVSSYQSWIHKNQWNNTGSSYGNCPEGILHQDHLNGSECWSSALTYNKGSVYTGVYNSQAIGYFMGWNQVTSGTMLANIHYAADVSVVDHTNYNTGEYYGNTDEASNISTYVKDYKVWKCDPALIFEPYPTPGVPTISVKDTADFVLISWSNVDNEAAYRVERKLDKPGAQWTPIAYRPRQHTSGVVTFDAGDRSLGFIKETGGHPAFTWDGVVRNLNPPVWRDYLKVAGENVKYRVVAIACDDAASPSISDSVSIEVVTGKKEPVNNINERLLVFPNPAKHIATVVYPLYNSKKVRAEIISLSGLVVASMQDNSASGSMNIDVSDLQSGMYILQLKFEDGKTIATKLLVE